MVEIFIIRVVNYDSVYPSYVNQEFLLAVRQAKLIYTCVGLHTEAVKAHVYAVQGVVGLVHTGML